MAATLEELENVLAKQFAVLQVAVSQHVELMTLAAEARIPPPNDASKTNNAKAGDSVSAGLLSTAPVQGPANAIEATDCEAGVNSLSVPLITNQADDGDGSDPKDRPRPKSPAHNSRKSNFFPELDALKSTVQDAHNKAKRDLEDYYHETGCWQALARSDLFKNMALLTIVLNTLWIAVDTDMNKADLLCDAPVLFQVVDNVFCTVFTAEILVRFMAYKRKVDAFRDARFWFDAVLVGLMVWETWVMVWFFLLSGTRPNGSGAKSSSVLRVFRVFRLSRVARMGRLLKSFPELFILVKALWVGVRSVISILVLLCLLVYVFAIMFTQLLAGTHVGAGKFDTVPQAMNFLLLQTLCGFDTDFIEKLLNAGLVYYALYLLFLLIGSLTIMNMLIGILCEVVSTVAAAEKDEAFTSELEFQVTNLAKKLDTDQNGKIGQTEFEAVSRDPDLVQHLDDLGVDIVAISDYASFIFKECEELNFSDFLQMVGQFRGDKNATVKDFMEQRRFFSVELGLVKNTLSTHMSQMGGLIKASQQTLASPTEGQEPRTPRECCHAQ